ncbi:MAG: hypothetical protein KAS99_00230 [Candidatus Omnitrophica bacterium]|nr:hypothetical protein [Candidatus Omnitrophota bacterium]
MKRKGLILGLVALAFTSFVLCGETWVFGLGLSGPESKSIGSIEVNGGSAFLPAKKMIKRVETGEKANAEFLSFGYSTALDLSFPQAGVSPNTQPEFFLNPYKKEHFGGEGLRILSQEVSALGNPFSDGNKQSDFHYDFGYRINPSEKKSEIIGAREITYENLDESEDFVVFFDGGGRLVGITGQGKITTKYIEDLTEEVEDEKTIVKRTTIKAGFTITQGFDTSVDGRYENMPLEKVISLRDKYSYTEGGTVEEEFLKDVVLFSKDESMQYTYFAGFKKVIEDGKIISITGNSEEKYLTDVTKLSNDGNTGYKYPAGLTITSENGKIAALTGRIEEEYLKDVTKSSSDGKETITYFKGSKRVYENSLEGKFTGKIRTGFSYKKGGYSYRNETYLDGIMTDADGYIKDKECERVYKITGVNDGKFKLEMHDGWFNNDFTYQGEHYSNTIHVEDGEVTSASGDIGGENDGKDVLQKIIGTEDGKIIAEPYDGKFEIASRRYEDSSNFDMIRSLNIILQDGEITGADGYFVSGGIAVKSNFESLNINTDDLFENLEEKRYINDKGEIQVGFTNLSDSSEMKLDGAYKNKREEIYDILLRSSEKRLYEVVGIEEKGEEKEGEKCIKMQPYDGHFVSGFAHEGILYYQDVSIEKSKIKNIAGFWLKKKSLRGEQVYQITDQIKRGDTVYDIEIKPWHGAFNHDLSSIGYSHTIVLTDSHKDGESYESVMTGISGHFKQDYKLYRIIDYNQKYVKGEYISDSNDVVVVHRNDLGAQQSKTIDVSPTSWNANHGLVRTHMEIEVPKFYIRP